MTDKLPEDWECLGCRQTVTDGEYDFCMKCLAKNMQYDLDWARDYWKSYQEEAGELNGRNIAAGATIDMQMLDAFRKERVNND